MSKQTSIEWLIDQVEDFIGLIPVDIIQQAKQMHKEEIEDAYFNGGADSKIGKYKTRQIYYQETYGGNNE